MLLDSFADQRGTPKALFTQFLVEKLLNLRGHSAGLTRRKTVGQSCYTMLLKTRQIVVDGLPVPGKVL